ncbi:MAG TPA: ABC transporter permease [Vicinamibacterales bacterium]|nr:ABC transporter permease [Vicinamibacterales bacterium]
MPLWPKVRSFWRTVARGRRLDDDLDAELRAYLDERAERRIAQGMDPAAARREAAIEMGGVESLKERVRDVRIGRLVEETLRDIAYAWRMLRKAPGFTAAAVATLAIGVGANTAIFSVVNALLIEPPPYADPSRLVFVWADQTAEGYPRAPLSGPELTDLDVRTSRFDGFGAIWATTAALTGDNEPEQLRIGLVSADFFALLGAKAALGRTFVESDVVTGSPGSILLSSAVWQRRYGSDPDIAGKRILVNGTPTTVVGVMPADFRLLMPPDAAVPDDLEAWLLLDRRLPEFPRGQRFLRVIGRMRPGVTIAQAADDVSRVGEEISRAFADYGAAGRQFEMVALHADAVREIRGPLLAMFGGVAILLLIACVNVASLLIARAAARTRETAVRIALGAGHARLLRQHLVEGLLVTAVGVAAGLLAGRWALDVLLALAPPALSRLSSARIDGTVVAFSVAIMVAWGALLSLAPLSEVWRVRLATAIRLDAARSGRGGHRLRSWLIAGQVAMSVVLLVGALLLVRTFVNVRSIDPGFDARGVHSFRVAVRAPSRDRAVTFTRHLQAQLSAIPGVAAAASMSHAPYDHVPNWGGPYISQPGADASTAPQADYRSLSPGALELMGIRLVEGRSFAEADNPDSTPVVIVDRRLAERTWPGASAVGRRLGVDVFVTGKPDHWATVVGVVEHVRHRSPVEEVREQVYFAQRQAMRNPSVYVIKSDAGPATLVPAVREALKALDPSLPIYDVRPLSAYVDAAVATRAFTMRLAVVFAVAALVLASVGIYGVIAYSVALRHREFGVRRALGAEARQVMGAVVREGAVLLGRGVGTGIAVAAAATWFMRGLLFGVGPWDLATYAAAIPALLLVGAAACLLPARRAMRVSPADALRAE